MQYCGCLLLFILFVGSSLEGFSQNTRLNEDSILVYQTVVTLFDGMRDGDTTKMRTVFDKEVRMISSLISKEGEMITTEGELNKFLSVVGTPHPEVWDERIFNTVIQIDGGIAHVWTDYVLYVGTKFIHCGVDAFQLIKRKDKEWKIVNLMDTRRKENCDFE